MADSKNSKKRKNPNTKSGKNYSLSDLVSGKVTLDEAIADTKFDKRVGTVKSVDKKTPKTTTKEVKSILKMKDGGKVRGAGIARKGVRPAKMR
mgnify:FL=1